MDRLCGQAGPFQQFAPATINGCFAFIHEICRQFPRKAFQRRTVLPIPIGIVFGTSFVQYEQWASRGFADPMAYILFIAGLLTIVSASSAKRGNLASAFFGTLLLALAIFMKPIVAPATAVLLGGTGLAASDSCRCSP